MLKPHGGPGPQIQPSARPHVLSDCLCSLMLSSQMPIWISTLEGDKQSPGSAAGFPALRVLHVLREICCIQWPLLANRSVYLYPHWGVWSGCLSWPFPVHELRAGCAASPLSAPPDRSCPGPAVPGGSCAATSEVSELWVEQWHSQQPWDTATRA